MSSAEVHPLWACFSQPSSFTKPTSSACRVTHKVRAGEKPTAAARVFSRRLICNLNTGIRRKPSFANPDRRQRVRKSHSFPIGHFKIPPPELPRHSGRHTWYVGATARHLSTARLNRRTTGSPPCRQLAPDFALLPSAIGFGPSNRRPSPKIAKSAALGQSS